jgi:TrmH family RNA methyltransferase
MNRITSRDNASYKLLRALAGSSRERRKQGKTLLDGMHLVATWTARHGLPEIVAVSERAAAQGEIRAFLERHSHLTPLVFGDALFQEISPVATPTGIVAAVRPPPPPPAEMTADGSCVLLDAIQDAGNLGSILRSIAASGVHDVFLGHGCAQAWSPRVLRAGMGAHFALRIRERAALDAILRDFRGCTVAATLHGRTAIYQLDLSGPVAWIFGNEGAGLAAQFESLARHAAAIPMPGGSESLNVAAAAAVCLFEEVRQKSLAAAVRTPAGRAVPPA